MTARTHFQRFAVTAGVSLAMLVAGCNGGGSGDRDTDDLSADAPGVGSGDGGTGSESILSRPVDSETLPYADVNDQLVYGHFAFPSDMIEPLPAIIVLHDWWGLNDDVRSMANRLAAEGYMVLAIDLYGGETVSDIQAAREKTIAVVEDPASAEENLSQALEFVAIAGAPGTAALGWGLGGVWSLNAAMLFPDDINAAVVYYGQLTDDEDKLRAIKAPVLALFGAKDRGITRESITKFEAAMQRLRKPVNVQVYSEVGHAFADPARSNYNSQIADNAFRRCIEFLAANITDTDES